MLKKKIEKALNEQLNAELYSAYLYYSMAAYFEAENLSGLGNWMRAQAMEELSHMDKFFKFINERGGKVELKEIKAPDTKWEHPVAVFTQVCEHEASVTDLINELMDLAIKEKDFATKIFLDWFVSEQVEEEATAGKILHDLKAVKKSSQGLFMLDRELGQRAFTMPAENE